MNQAPATSPIHPDFRSRRFLLGHVRDTMAFYHPRCIDPAGGFFQFFKDDGSVYDPHTRHLVSSTRFVFNYSMAWQAFGQADYRDAVGHGVAFLRQAHRNPDTGGYAWVLHDRQVADATNHCYGLAFVVLAYAKALEAGMDEARGWLEETWALMERHFWEPEHGLYADEATADWRVSPYRGQNANMHACEAWLAAFEASGEERYLRRAALLADNMTRRQAALADGLVWEHYRRDWSVDWDYNRGDRSNIFRPWGYQPGHQTEWAKLLLILDRHAPADWRLPRARELFDRAVAMAWDEEHGGLVYGNDREGRFYDEDKYFWVQAESLATAALLGARTGEPRYWQWYGRLWEYCWARFVDHEHGAWYRILGRDNRKYDDEKSPAGKTDYHTMGACYEVLKVV
ncbi:N-acylglucosamine 2-epimerase [Pseudoxanthomonas broegbernensis]|uniref:N-acylglucosamine 2-epimerase n=1 Tax=Pseudoxanthomonas broegbernensis TaxID=83619 RepID=A0A7V8K7R6_9GAMM|nr:AGE family epimerase/isomerase [Pseudoxanthomonas broegbernensis]KAF1686898.1 N-acylglucosamine 2-epimerase [Pseudoxanthomonas broegbernensis]MBB6065508.1 mannose/cellobiose epimerase-like protein (N-acyl-D-glucosamine 2-epimerase family) [Pseudoxanthomonas broegbernensis]